MTVLKNWQKEFDERFSPEWWHGFGTTEDINKLGIEGIKKFIQDLLLSQQEQRDGEKFTKTEIEQLQSYCEARDRESWYYGPKTQFEKRHSNIVRKLFSLLKESKV